MKKLHHLHLLKRRSYMNYSLLKYIDSECNNMNKYKEAIDTLNTLQSNAAYIKERAYKKSTYSEEYSRTILQMKKFLSSAGITNEKLNNLQVIHVAGTKGKGSTCAFCESILKHHGYKTGFYSSPHLIEVRERIRINGEPISHEIFAENFWYIYNKLYKANPNHLPTYFRFLTLMAFHVFIAEKVDVAIIEVGIGGEFDCTNALERVPVVGITSLGIDHTGLLGKTIEDIAWHKSGIFKENCKAYTVPQCEDAMTVLWQRSRERKTILEVIHPFINIKENGKKFPDAINMNASLAVMLSYSWIKSNQGINASLKEFTDSSATKLALKKFKWPGRYQIIYGENVNYYLDGAHTLESMKICANWFKMATKNSSRKRALIFNLIGDRDAEKILYSLLSCHFNKVFFVPNISGKKFSIDTKIQDLSLHLAKCNENRKIWIELLENNNLDIIDANINTCNSVFDAIEDISNKSHDCLITGSLHLMGAALDVLDPKFKQTQDDSKFLIENFIISS